MSLKNLLAFTHFKGWVIINLVFLFIACEKDPKAPEVNPSTSDSNAFGMFVCSEGNYNWGNASLGFYDTKKQVFKNDIFKSNNNHRLGDVCQSMQIIDGVAWLIINNSGKIELMDSKTFKSVGTIQGFNSPRYLLKINSNKAYVSDLYEKCVYLVNLNTKQISGKISINSWTEEMVLHQQKAFVCGRSSSYVYVIDTSIDAVTDSIDVGYGAQNMVIDQNQKIWVLTYGNATYVPQLHRLDPEKGIEKTFHFKSGETPARLFCNKNRTQIYWLNQGVFSKSVLTDTWPVTPILQANGRTFYGLGIDEVTGNLFVSDAKDYVQRSEIIRCDSLGNIKGTFLAGVNTGYFFNKP